MYYKLRSKILEREKMKNLQTQTRAVVIRVFVCCVMVYCLSAEADPFYNKLFQEGKVLVAQGKYPEAIENFRIAEFGLYEEKEILKELYFFYSLAYLKTGKMGDALKVVKKVETELNGNIKPLNVMDIPQNVKNDAKALTITMARTWGQVEAEAGSKSWEKVYLYESLFWNILQDLENNKLDTVNLRIKRLERLDKNDPRADYLSGILLFKKEKYKASLNKLINAVPSPLLVSIDPSLEDNRCYYLALSYHYLQYDEYARGFYQKIKDRIKKAELEEKINKRVKGGSQ
ncbi:MAG: hypothetical protein JSV88_18165 [Candidatus Aminicenantes bacterium]|nr:MAG: hypothetical protein JSV88_18165 [Candidatus Aminicenantes bacterium]